MNIREFYHIPKESKILLYVGNISKNKNQEQMVRAFELIPEETRNNTYILFIGRNLQKDYSIDDLIEKSPYKNHLILCGNIDKKDMPNFYSQADGVSLFSISEGFGLSLIEGMHFGIPCVTFTDLDAYEDIYDKCAVIGIKERSDEEVAKSIYNLLHLEWNRAAIVDYSKKFGRKQMASKYLETYLKIIC